jgi:integrase
VRLDSAGAHVELLDKGHKERVVPLWAETAQVLRAWFRELGGDGSGVAFAGARGRVLSGDGVDHLLRRAVATPGAACPGLGAKKVSPHVLRPVQRCTCSKRDDPRLRRCRPGELAPMPGIPDRCRPDDKFLALLAAL